MKQPLTARQLVAILIVVAIAVGAYVQIHHGGGSENQANAYAACVQNAGLSTTALTACGKP